MRSVSVLFFIGICVGWAQAQFLNNRPFPTYSLENMPDTEFSCRDKILGGYYADADTQCQMFHICVKVAGVGIQDFRFLCPNSTAFDQDHQICADWEDVDCDATTLYYSSDNFDLYRIGSGFESKAVKYGEDEETFALQRAETGDARINRDHQNNSVNQRKEVKDNYQSRPAQPRQNNNYNQNNDRDIFKASSSSNFFNNKNNGKEKDEDYDDNVNVNQDRDYEQKKKVTRVKQQRRPVQSRQQNNDSNRNYQEPSTQKNNEYEIQTRRPARPTGFINNFAGSSYVPTTSRPSSTTVNNEQYDNAVNNYRGRQGQRQRPQQQQYNEADNVRQTSNSSPATSTTTPVRQTQQYNKVENFRQTNSNSPTPNYSISTSAPFRQTQQYNTPPLRQQPTASDNNNAQQFTSTQNPSRETENYPQQKSKQTTPYNDQYDTPKAKPTKKDNYPTTIPQNYNTQYDIPKTRQTENYPSKATPFSKTENYPSNNPVYNDKKPTTPLRQTENYPTTFSTKAKPFSASSEPGTNLPTTFAPRTSAAFTQIVQQTQNYNSKQPTNNQQYNSQKTTTQYSNPSTFNQQYPSQTKSSTPKSTAYTQYTPTVPKITSTTPVSRSNRFDETQYDDGSYNSKFDSDKREDEFLKTAHSQNIAASRNELGRTTKQQQSTQKPQFDSPRPFSVSPNTPKVSVTPKVTEIPKSTVGGSTKTTQQAEPSRASSVAPKSKKTKDVSYDYAYYDSNPSSEPEYDIEADIKKSTVRN